MTPYTMPEHLRAAVAPEVASFIERHQSTRLPRATWLAVEAPLKDLVARSLPPNALDAKVTLSLVAKFLAWVEPLAGTADPHTVITPAWIDRYVRQRESAEDPSTLSNTVGRLRRIIRVLDGETACTRRGRRADGPSPYTATELAAIAAVADRCPDLAHLLDTVQQGTFKQVDPRAPWAAIRRAVAKEGVTLLVARLRATSVHRALNLNQPIAVTIREQELTRNDVDSAVNHLSLPDPTQMARLLRT